MKTKNFVRSFLNLLFSLLVLITSCKTSTEEIKSSEIQLQLQKQDSIRIEREKNFKKENFQDSIAISNFIITYNPLVFNYKHEDLYFYKLKEILLSHSNLMLIKGEILDIDKDESKNLIVIDPEDFGGIVILHCSIKICEDLVKKIGEERSWQDGIFVLRINKLTPVYRKLITEVDEDHVGIEIKSDSPSFMINGELLDYFLK